LVDLLIAIPASISLVTLACIITTTRRYTDSILTEMLCTRVLSNLTVLAYKTGLAQADVRIHNRQTLAAGLPTTCIRFTGTDYVLTGRTSQTRRAVTFGTGRRVGA